MNSIFHGQRYANTNVHGIIECNERAQIEKTGEKVKKMWTTMFDDVAAGGGGIFKHCFYRSNH